MERLPFSIVNALKKAAPCQETSPGKSLIPVETLLPEMLTGRRGIRYPVNLAPFPGPSFA